MAKLQCFAFLFFLAWKVCDVDCSDEKNAISRFFTDTSDEVVEPFSFECLENGHFQNVRNCSTFIQCSNGKSYLMPCPDNLHFSNKTGKCERQCDAHCDRTLACDCGWPTCTKEVCFVPRDAGPCGEHIDRYYYNKELAVCKHFIYFGCGGNENNFETIKDCEKICGDVIDVCKLPPRKGPCKIFSKKYFFNSKKGRCQKFSFGGCQGNGNNFDTIEKCEQKCFKEVDDIVSEEIQDRNIEVLEEETKIITDKSDERTEDSDEATESSEVELFDSSESTATSEEGSAKRLPFECLSDPDPGPCTEKLPRWNYVSRKDKCIKFTYGGCEGNGNNFISKTECKIVCANEKKAEAAVRYRYCFKSGLQPYFRSCKYYVYCLNQIGYLMKCPPGLHFNFKKQMCVTPCDAFCDQDFACICKWRKCLPNEPKCPKPNGNFSVLANCSIYMECIDSKSTLRECPKGNSFDVINKTCVPYSEARCYLQKREELESQTFKCPEKAGNFSVSTNCSQYIECEDSSPITKECPSGQSFDSKKKLCVPWYEAICDLSNSRDLKFPMKFICPERNGNFSVPLDCTKYFNCNDSESTPKECPHGKFFDSRKKICVPWYEALCYPGKWAQAAAKHIRCHPEGDFSYDPDCKKFLRCRKTVLSLNNCPEGETFDTAKRQCLPDDEAKCIR